MKTPWYVFPLSREVCAVMDNNGTQIIDKISPEYAAHIVRAVSALAEPQECTWTPDLRGITTTDCGLNDVLIMEGTRAVYCFNCGKKIKFVEGE